MPKKYKCGGCKRYISDDEIWRQTSLQRWCSQECYTGQPGLSQNATRPDRKPSKRRKDDIPASTRETVLRRDSGSCRFCGVKYGLHLHHINYRSEGVDHSPHNLITLCHEHHDLVHSNKKKWKPVLLGVIWMMYVENKMMRVPQFARWYGCE